MKETLEWLEQWYLKNQPRERGNSPMIRIETIGNPGWGVSICIEGTDMEMKKFERIGIDLNDNDWVFCRVKNGFFEGDGSPGKLEYMLKAFKNWVTE